MNKKRVTILKQKNLTNSWSTLDKISFEYQKKDGGKEIHTREVYNRGNGAAILLYNTIKNTIILTSQFRLATYLNGNTAGDLIEVCAGKLDDDSPEDCIRRETEEETGYRVTAVQKVFEAYMSPGSVTEMLYFYIAAYDENMKIGSGGGVAGEQEYIEVLEIEFNAALQMIDNGSIKDAKTILLLQYLQIKGILSTTL